MDWLRVTPEARSALQSLLRQHPDKVVRLVDDGCSCGGKQVGLVLSVADESDVIEHDGDLAVHISRFDRSRVPGVRIEWFGGEHGFLAARPVRRE